MLFGMGGACMWLLGNMIHLIWSEDYSTYPQFNIRLNTLLRVDSLLILTWALVCFAFPNVFIHLLVSFNLESSIVIHISIILKDLRNVHLQ